MPTFTDVQYDPAGGALAAAIIAPWDAATPTHEHTVRLDTVAAYEPGRFYLRELPCLLALLASLPPPDVVVVDAHAWLDGRPGLGAHLHDATGLPVVGVAKRAFAGGVARPVLRGTSAVPLWVSTAGFDLDDACRLVAAMPGPYRIPRLIKRADQLARGR